MDNTIQKALGLQMNGFNTEALNIFQNAIKKEPHNLILCEYLGAALAGEGQLIDAKKYLKKSLTKTIEKPQVLNNLATVNRGLNLTDEALLNVNSALKFKPDYIDAWINRANIYSDLKQWPEAIFSFENAIKLNTYDKEPYKNLAHAYLHNLEFDKALDLYKLSQKKFNSPEFLIGELICYRAMGEFDLAIDFAKVLKDQFNDKIMWFEWVQTLWMAKEYSKVKIESDIAITKFGSYPEMIGILDLLDS